MNKYLLLFTTYLFPLFHELDHETDESVKEATGGNEDGMEGLRKAVTPFDATRALIRTRVTCIVPRVIS